LEEEVKELNEKVTLNINEMETIINEIELLSVNQADNQSLINSLLSVTNMLQNQINESVVRIVELESQDSVVDLYDPCDDAPNKYDEVLLRMKSGKLIAYFEQGNKRFLTELSSGNYATTDGTNCFFTIE
jgi:hypothetical protein